MRADLVRGLNILRKRAKIYVTKVKYLFKITLESFYLSLR